MALVSTLTDNFATQDGGKWSYSDGATIVSGQLNVTGNNQYDYVYANASYDLTGSSAIVEVASAANGGANPAVTSLVLDIDGANRLSFEISQGNIEASNQIADVKIISVTVPYSTINHKWLRIRESSGTIYWDHSANGITWTNLASGAAGIPITALYPLLFAGGIGGIYTAVFDNFNLPPVVITTGAIATAVKKATASVAARQHPKGTVAAALKKATAAFSGPLTAPTITGIIPNPGPAGTVTITGTGFVPPVTVDFADPAPPPSAPKIQTLTDNFATQDGTKWSYSTGASIISGQLSITGNNQYDYIYSNAVYDLTGSYAIVQVPSAANAGANPAVTSLTLEIDGPNRLNMEISNGNIEANNQVAGVKVITVTAAYNSTNHKWLRIREAAGVIYWDYSANGISWSNLTSGAAGIPITALHLTLFAGGIGGIYTAVFDNFNLPPIQTGTIATAVRKATAALTGTAAIGAPHGTIASTARKAAASFTGVAGARGTIAGALTKTRTASIGTMHPKGTIGAAVKHPRAALVHTTTATSGIAVPFPVPGILGPPVNTAQGHYGWQGRGATGLVFGVDTTNPATNPKLVALEKALLDGDPVSRAIAADDIVAFEEQFDKKWIITIYDYLWRPLGELGDDVMEMTGTDPRNNVPTLKIKVKGTSQHIDTFKDCMRTMVGITVEVGALRHAYYVDTFDWEYQEAEWVGTANCRGIWDVLSFLQVWANFLLPIQAQIPSHAIFIGPIVTCINVMIAECALRIQTGLWEFVNNALSLNLDVRAWFGTLLLSNGNFLEMLKCPIYVSVINPLIDTSPLIARTVRFESCAQVIQDITRAYGVDVSINLWLPGDEQPDEWTKTFAIMRLDQPTYVVKAVDRSQIEGPTKSILDSVLRTIVDIFGSFFGDIGPLVQSVPGMQGVFVSPLLGIKFVPPWAVVIAPDIGEKGSVATCKLSFHTPKGWQHIIGGRSPKWLNDLMNAIFGYILDAASIFIGIIGIPSDLLSGLLNNAFLAFQLIEHFGRRAQVGPYHPGIEVMHPTPTAPYNIETVFGFINALWDSRGYMSGQFVFRDGDVYTYGKDIFRGGLVSLVFDGRKKLFTDYVENCYFRYTPDARDVFVQVGDGKAEEAPLAKHQRFITGVIESINVVTLAPQS